MKVVLLAENWPPRVGGIENYLTHIAGGLPHGDVTVVAPSARGIKNEELGIKHIDVVRRRFFWPIVKPSWLPLFVWLYRRVRRERPSVILCGKALFEGLVGYYLKRFLGIPYVVFTYALEIEQWAQGSPRVRRKLERVLLNADRVVYINETTKALLVKLGVTESQLVKIWPGVDQRLFDEPSTDTLSQTLSNFGIQQPYILAVCRLVERKGVDVLIEAFAQLDQSRFADVQLVVAGSGPQQESLEHLAEHLLLNAEAGNPHAARRVLFLGHVSDEQLAQLYAGSLFFALTPKQLAQDSEGFGIVYIEAGAAKRAVVGTSTGGVSEAVVHKETGLLVETDSIDAVREALTFLLTHEQERADMGRQGHERAWHQFRWSKRILLVKGMLDAIVAEQKLALLKAR